MCAVLVLAACGDDDDSADSSSATTASPETTGDTAAAPSGDPIVIGLGNTEAEVIQAKGAREALEAAVEWINTEEGGVNGRPLELESCASQGTPESASQCANQIVAADPVAVVLQGVTDETPYVNATNAAGIPVFVFQGSGATLTSDNSFSLNAGIIGLHAAVAQYALDQGYSSVSLLTADVPAARGAAESAVPNYEAAGLEVNPLYIPPATADMTPGLTSAMSTDPQLIFATTDPATCISSLKGIDLVGFEGDYVQAEACYTQSVIEGAGDAFVGAIVPKAAADVSAADSDDPDVQLYRHILETYSPDTPVEDRTAANAMSAFMLLYNSVLKGLPADGVDAAAVLDAAHAIQDAPIFMLPGGEATCDGAQVPELIAVCSSSYLFYKVNDDLKLDFIDTIDAGPVLRQDT